MRLVRKKLRTAPRLQRDREEPRLVRRGRARPGRKTAAVRPGAARISLPPAAPQPQDRRPALFFPVPPRPAAAQPAPAAPLPLAEKAEGCPLARVPGSQGHGRCRSNTSTAGRCLKLDYAQFHRLEAGDIRLPSGEEPGFLLQGETYRDWTAAASAYNDMLKEQIFQRKWQDDEKERPGRRHPGGALSPGLPGRQRQGQRGV